MLRLERSPAVQRVGNTESKGSQRRESTVERYLEPQVRHGGWSDQAVGSGRGAHTKRRVVGNRGQRSAHGTKAQAFRGFIGVDWLALTNELATLHSRETSQVYRVLLRQARANSLERLHTAEPPEQCLKCVVVTGDGQHGNKKCGTGRSGNGHSPALPSTGRPR